MKKLIALIVVLGAIGAGGYWYVKYGTPEVKPIITEAGITRGSIAETVKATGTLDALRTVDIGTQVSGVVKTLYADYNTVVKAGDLLAELDPSLLETQVNVQKANLRRSEVDLSQRKITLENDQKKLERQRELFTKNLVTKEALENAELQVKMDQASIDSSAAALVQTQANLSQAELNVSYTKIYAPIDGVITVRNTDQGRTVNASTSSPTLYTMATDLTKMKLTASIDEADVSRVRANQPVTFLVDSYGGQTFRGTVRQVRLNAKNSQNVVTYETVIDVDNGDLRLKPGMTGNLTIEIQRVDNVLRIPSAALRFRPTAEMFELLKQPVPPEAQAGAGRGAGGAGGRTGGRNGGNGGDAGAAMAPGGAAAPGATPGATTGATTGGAAQGGGQGRQRGDATQQGGNATMGGGRGGNQGGGNFGGATGGRGGNRGGFNMTPEQQKQFDAIRNNTKLTDEQRRAEMAKLFPTMGGRGQGGGRNGGGRNNGQQASGPGIADRGAKTIDELLPAVVRRETPNQRVWVSVNGTLKPINGLRTGITDGQFTELVTGEIKEGDKIVTNFVIPGAKPTTATPQQGNPFQQQQGGRGGPGGGGGGRGGF